MKQQPLHRDPTTRSEDVQPGSSPASQHAITQRTTTYVSDSVPSSGKEIRDGVAPCEGGENKDENRDVGEPEFRHPFKSGAFQPLQELGTKLPDQVKVSPETRSMQVQSQPAEKANQSSPSSGSAIGLPCEPYRPNRESRSEPKPAILSQAAQIGLPNPPSSGRESQQLNRLGRFVSPGSSASCLGMRAHIQPSGSDTSKPLLPKPIPKPIPKPPGVHTHHAAAFLDALDFPEAPPPVDMRHVSNPYLSLTLNSFEILDFGE